MKRIFIVHSLFLTLTLFAHADDCPPGFEYSVQDKQSLTKILSKNRLRPIYGAEGYLNYISQLNNLKDPDVIYPQDKIVLQRKCLPIVPSTMQATPAIEKAPTKVVEAQPVDLEPIPVEIQPDSPKQFYAGLGLGVTTLAFSQSDDSQTEFGGFTTNLNPTGNAVIGIDFKDRWNIEFNYSQIKSSIKVSSNLTVNTNSVNLQKYSLIARYSLNPAGPLKFRARFGVERNQIPYLISGTGVDVEVLVPELTQADIGADLAIKMTDIISWLVTARILPVISSSVSKGSFKAKSGMPFALDAKVIYQINEKWRAFGLLGYQKQDIKFSYEPQGGGSNTTGKVDHSATEFRLQAEYLF